MNYPHLFTPGKIGCLELKNRIVMPAMETIDAGFNGEVTDELIRYYEERARAGVGLIIPAYATVDEEFSPSFDGAQLKVTQPRHITGLVKLARVMHKYDAKVMIQIYMAGRQSVPTEISGKRMIAPSAVGYSLHNQIPEEMTREEIKRSVQKFARAAKLIQQADIDGVEILAAGGYLITEFMSPASNKRTDEYGGSFENRMRFLTEIIEAVRAECGPKFPVMVRFCGDEFLEDGYNLEEGVRIAKLLESVGVDALSVNNANQECRYRIIEPTTMKAGWKSYIIKAIKEAVSIPVIATNVIKMPEEAEKFLAEGLMDFAAVARANFADGQWARKAREGRPEDIRPCIGCLYCMDEQVKFHVGSCAVNVRALREGEFPAPKRDLEGRNVVVVGAGPSGMEAAMVCAERGAAVTVFEKNDYIGGDAQLGARTPDKEVLGRLSTYYAVQAKKLGISVRLNTEASVENVMACQPYAVFMATGGAPIIPPFKGLDEIEYMTISQALDRNFHVSGKKITVIGGGMTGIETAEHFALMGNDVAVVEMQAQLAPEVHIDTKITCLENLKKCNADIRLKHKVVEFKNGAVIAENLENGEKVEIPQDLVIMSLGKRSDRVLGEKLKAIYERVYFVGDAKQGGRIANAVHTGYQAAYVME